jgi:hypothetical protein
MKDRKIFLSIFLSILSSVILFLAGCASVKYNSSDPRDIYGVEVCKTAESLSDVLSTTHFGLLYSSYNIKYDKKKNGRIRLRLVKEVPSKLVDLLCYISTGHKAIKGQNYKSNEELEMLVKEYVFVTANYYLHLGFKGRNILLKNIQDAIRLSKGGAKTADYSNMWVSTYKQHITNYNKYLSSVKYKSYEYQCNIAPLIANVIFDFAQYLADNIGGPVLNLKQIKARLDRLNQVIELGAPSGVFRGKRAGKLWADLEKDMGYLSWQSALLHMQAAGEDLAKAREARKRAAEEFLNR